MASTVLAPGSGPSVRDISTRPLASVLTLLRVNLPPKWPSPSVTAKVTSAPGSGLSYWSLTSRTNGSSS